MLKSTARPVNRTPNATESGLSEPIASAAKLAVSVSPIASVARIAPTSFKDRIAANKIAQTRTIEVSVERSAPSRKVANCSSLSATEPVIRTCTPCAGSSWSSRASRRTSSSGRAPRSSAAKSSTGRASTKRRRSRGLAARPVIIRCHENGSERPAKAASTALAIAVSVGFSRMIAAWSFPTFDRNSVSVSNRPRRLGSPARLPISGCAAISFSEIASSSATGRNNRPLWSKNGPPSGRRT